ncbi:MAG TPA: hypothetical protein VK864_18440, partial [Longimicrobiales bacterium]|nr:hypothetical protein [Longimicrobiales bacterium]
DEYNRVVAADTRIVFKKLYYVEGQVGGSWSRDEYGNARSGRLWKLDADRTGRRWGFHYGINALDNEFDARAGFVPRVGIVTARAFNRLSFYGSPGALAQQFSIFAGPTYYWRYDDFPNSGALEGSESANLSLRLRGGWNLTGNIGRIFFNLDDYNHLQVQTPGGPQPYRALDEISGPSFQGSITTPTYRRFDANLTIGQSAAPLFAEGSEGSGWTAFGGVSVRPTTSIRIGWTGGVQHFERVRDGDEYARTVLSRWKVEYQPTRALFFRAIADSRDERQAALEAASTGEPLLLNGQPVSAFERRNLRIDLLVSYEPRPGTVAFFGYGAGLLEEPPLTSRLERMTDGFFVKLAYQFRR